ncbi:MAG: glycerol-3-phosphate acyltransferase [Aggregatilineales bacterium]
MDATDFMRWAAVVAASYLLGAIPTAYLVCRAHGVDIFTVGSGNMGATNVARALNLWWGIAVWLMDMGKGVLAILLARLLLPHDPAAATAVGALAAIVGHNWSVFVVRLTGRLRGGKGASIAFAALALIAPHVVLVVSLIGGAILLATRYVSLTVLVMLGLATVWIVVLSSQNALAWEYALYALLALSLTLYRFRDNIQRLLRGTERRLGDRV